VSASFGPLAGITHSDVDHLMIYDAFAHLPIYGLEDLGFVPRGEAGDFIAGHNTAPGGKLSLNTVGGGLSYIADGLSNKAAARRLGISQQHRQIPRRVAVSQAWRRQPRRRGAQGTAAAIV